MWGILGVIVLTGLIFFIDGLPLIRKKKKKEVTIFLLFLLSAGVVSILNVVGIHLPNPIDLLISLYHPLSYR